MIFDKDTADDGDCTDGGGSSRYFYAQQANWNVVAVTDSSGDTAERIKYDPYGEATVAVQSGHSSTGNSYLFQARRWDSEVELYYFRNRVLSPVLGRFFQRDPWGYADGLHLYEFSASNPVANADPMGRIVKEPRDTYAEFFSNAGQIYTCRCGWLDQQHLLPAARRTLIFYKALKRGQTKGGLRETFKKYSYLYKYTFTYRLNPRFPSTSEAMIGTAERLSYQFSTGFEQAQSSSIMQEWLFRSSFSLEDQTSNYLGSQLAREYLQSIGDRDPNVKDLEQYVERRLPEYCGDALPGERTLRRFEQKGWHVKKIKDGRKPFLMPRSDPCNTCPQDAGRPEILDRPWHTWGFRSKWQFEESYVGE